MASAKAIRMMAAGFAEDNANKQRIRQEKVQQKEAQRQAQELAALAAAQANRLAGRLNIGSPMTATDTVAQHQNPLIAMSQAFADRGGAAVQPNNKVEQSFTDAVGAEMFKELAAK